MCVCAVIMCMAVTMAIVGLRWMWVLRTAHGYYNIKCNDMRQCAMRSDFNCVGTTTQPPQYSHYNAATTIQSTSNTHTVDPPTPCSPQVEGMAALTLALSATPSTRQRYSSTLESLQSTLEQQLRVRGRTAYLAVDATAAAPARLDAQAMGLMALGAGKTPPQLLPKLAAGLAGRLHH